MDMNSKQQLTEVVAPRYRKATKREKKQILDEYCANTSYERKYAIKKLRKACLYPKKLRQARRKQTSNYALIKAIIKEFWELLDYPSAVRLKGLLPELLDKAKEYQEIPCSGMQKKLLAQISSATIERMLRGERRIRRRRLHSQTKPGTLLSRIPFACDLEKRTKPGYLELDLVVHCGESAMGDYINTLNTTDFASGWFEAEAIMGKSQKVVDVAMRAIEQRLPFPLLGIDSDNGSEFINGTVERFARQQKIEFTRSRPYKKNDNAHIEQKNWMHVRKVIGYLRLESLEVQTALNDLYRNELRLYINYFQPSQKLISKTRVGSKIKKKYDTPQTPYQRLLQDSTVPPSSKDKLQQEYSSLNPFALKRSLDHKLHILFTLIHNQRKAA